MNIKRYIFKGNNSFVCLFLGYVRSFREPRILLGSGYIIAT